MSGAIHPFPNTPPWRGAQLNHRDNFNITLYTGKSYFYYLFPLDSMYKFPIDLYLITCPL